MKNKFLVSNILKMFYKLDLLFKKTDRKFPAYSLIELMISIIAISLIVAAFTPVITKKLHSNQLTVMGNVECDVVGCLKCDSLGKCTSCSTGYYLVGGACATCGENCTMCDDEGMCTKCSVDSGVYIDGKDCKPCGDKCKDCDISTGECLSCESDVYYIDSSNNKQCIPCETNCATCDATTGACKTCIFDSLQHVDSANPKICVDNFTAKAYSTPGTYTFTVPDGVTKINVTLVGGGSGGNAGMSGTYESGVITSSGDITTLTETGGSSTVLISSLSGSSATFYACGGGGTTTSSWTWPDLGVSGWPNGGNTNTITKNIATTKYTITIGTAGGACNAYTDTWNGSSCTTGNGGSSTKIVDSSGTSILIAGGGQSQGCDCGYISYGNRCANAYGVMGEDKDYGTAYDSSTATSYFGSGYCAADGDGAAKITVNANLGGTGGDSGAVYGPFALDVNSGDELTIVVGAGGSAGTTSSPSGGSGTVSTISKNSVTYSSSSGTYTAGTNGTNTSCGVGGTNGSGYGTGGDGGALGSNGVAGSGGYVLLENASS